MPLNAGDRVGPYRILAPIGAGGMGEVYRAVDERLQREVALKILATGPSSSSEHLRRFEQEARAASALNHPNIITIYDIGRVDPISYIAMELIDGRDVRGMLTGERMQLKAALRIAVKVADGLGAAHDRGIVHRDLKPENLMVNRDGFVKILDFGLAKLVRPFTDTDTDTTVPHTTPGAVFGTVGYMSPEQASGHDTDYRSDQFALGVILYEMVTGRLPFTAPTAAEILALIIRTDPPPVTQFNDAVPPELVRIINRCLSKDRADRYASTRDLARDLREVRDRITNSSDPHRHSGRTSVVRPPRVAIYAIVAVVAVALATGSVIMFSGRVNTAAVAEAPGPRSIVVFPFGEPADSVEAQTFGEGVAEMIRRRLGKSVEFRVVETPEARGDRRVAARRAGAALMLDGRARREDDRVSISYRLLDVETGAPVTDGTVAGVLGQLFTVDDELPNATDQADYIEAVGLLQLAKDEKSVDQAIAALSRVLLNARDSAAVNALLGRAWHFKAQISRRPGLIDQAVTFAERAAVLDPDLPEVQITLGQLRRSQGRNDEALQHFQRALALRPGMPEALLHIAGTYERMGRAADAERMYGEAVSLRPNSASAHNQYGVFLSNHGRYSDALSRFRRVTDLQPDGPRGWANLGSAYQGLGDYANARVAYEKSIAVDPTAAAYSNLGTFHFAIGQYAEASRAFEKAVELAPSDYVVRANLGDAYRWSPGLREKSVETYRRAAEIAREWLDVNPKDAMAQAMMAASLAKSGRLDESGAAIRIALRNDPTNFIVLYQAALVAELRGNRDAAVTWLKSAIESGYPLQEAERDPELAQLREDPLFKSKK
ncbi:MAG TPA: tetratricopeptide repeat protein [Thermoanaerobaculia bacterium]|nr:tetratricopeptide repeat protein [Thermoanaerobaculia bacterium]